MMTFKMTPVAANGDADLVNASLRGSREAFEQIVSRYQSLVCSLAYSATGSLSQSEDLAQETFLAAWKHLADLHEPAKLRAWLCGIARNLINNALRAQGREPSHQAQSLEEVTEAHSVEPLPVERAISHEEAEILWRSLERIPETYRVPLVLFYREHQSIEAVAESLELSEEAVRQRLSRGRKLLQDEVLSFVETALQRTSPGKNFTLAVVGALPLATTSAKAVFVGAAVAKGGVGAKGAFAWGALGSLLGMVGAVLISWKNMADESKSPRERKLVVRLGWFQVIFFVLSMGASFYWLPTLPNRSLSFAIAFGGLILANLINCVVTSTYLSRRRIEIAMEEGTLLDAAASAPGKDSEAKLFWKTVKIMLPILLLFAFGIIGLPWKAHPLRSCSVVAGEALVVVWGFRRFKRQLSGQSIARVDHPKLQKVLRHPAVLLPVIVLGSMFVAMFLPLYLNPGPAKPGFSYINTFRTMWMGVGVAVLVYIVFALIWKRKLALGPGNAIDKAYAPLMRELNLDPVRSARLKELVLKKASASTSASMTLMHKKLDPAQRAQVTAQLKSDVERHDEQIREFLGEQEYQVFQRYEKTIPDRTIIDLFSSKLAGTRQALSVEQKEKLLQALSEARRLYNWTTELSRRNQATADLTTMFDEDNIDTFAREEEQFADRFQVQARAILSPEQLTEFAEFQKRQLKSQISGVKIAAKLFAKNR